MVRKFKYTDVDHVYMCGKYIPHPVRQDKDFGFLYDIFSIMDDLRIVFGILDRYKLGFDKEYVDELYDALYFARRHVLISAHQMLTQAFREHISIFGIYYGKLKITKGKIKKFPKLKEKMTVQFCRIFDSAKDHIYELKYSNYSSFLYNHPYFMSSRFAAEEYRQLMETINKLIEKASPDYFIRWEDYNGDIRFLDVLKNPLTYKYLMRYDVYALTEIIKNDNKSPLNKLKKIFEYLYYKVPEELGRLYLNSMKYDY